MDNKLKEYAKILGSRGGNSTKKKYGKKHFLMLNELRWGKRKGKKGKKLST